MLYSISADNMCTVTDNKFKLAVTCALDPYLAVLDWIQRHRNNQHLPVIRLMHHNVPTQ